MEERRWDLQLFAVQTTLLATEGNDLSPENKTFYEKSLIAAAEPQLVHDQFGDKYPIPKNGGKQIEFRRFSPLPKAMTPITEGELPPAGSLNVEKVPAALSQYGSYIEVSDVLDLTAVDPVLTQTTKLLGSQAGRTLDTVTREVLAAGTNVLYAPRLSGDTETRVEYRHMLDETAKLTPQQVRRAVTQLKRHNAPRINGYYVAIVHPEVTHDLMGHSEWLSAHQYAAPEQIFRGEIGRLYGVRFVESTEAKIFEGADLSASSRELTVASYTAASKTVTVSETLSAADIEALAGRRVIIGDEASVIVSATANTLVLRDARTAAPTAGQIVYPGEGGAKGLAVYGTLFLGANAYGVTEIEGGGLQHVMKPFGYNDALDLVASVGWKCMKTAEILIEPYMVRLESCSSFSGDTSAN